MNKSKSLDELLYDGVNKSIPSEEKPVTITDEDYLQKVKESEDYWGNRKMLTLIGMVQDLPDLLKEMTDQNEHQVKRNILKLGIMIKKAIDKHKELLESNDSVKEIEFIEYDRPYDAWNLYCNIIRENNLTEDAHFAGFSIPKKSDAQRELDKIISVR